ncbi:hypothetical protein E2C01_047690 [Portunus trituberculatus]|uniref:Uncharacterized protein n=1 Tax=Portunus trituberculatus TaxID=210409 RepID=A0A5B7G185_PORTR|nr:hypothetical protein [Portunus trituberculatus]
MTMQAGRSQCLPVRSDYRYKRTIVKITNPGLLRAVMGADEGVARGFVGRRGVYLFRAGVLDVDAISDTCRKARHILDGGSLLFT